MKSSAIFAKRGAFGLKSFTNVVRILPLIILVPVTSMIVLAIFRSKVARSAVLLPR